MRKVKSTLAFVFVLVAIILVSATGTVSVPKFGVHQPVTPLGTLIQSTITNRGTTPATVTPLYGAQSMAHVFTSKWTVAAWVLGEATSSDPEERKFQAMVAIAKIKKSGFHENTLLMTGEWLQGTNDFALVDSVRVRKHDPVGAFGSYHIQCFDFAADAIEIAVATGLWNYWEFHTVSLPAHSCLEFSYRGGWVFADYDSGEPGFIFRNTANANGYASTYDLCANHNLITTDQFYRWVNPETGDSINLCPWMTLSSYQALFANPSVLPLPFQHAPYERTGEWTISPGSTVSFSSGYTTTTWLLNTSFPFVSEMRTKITNWGNAWQAASVAHDTAMMTTIGQDSILPAYMSLLGVSRDSVIFIVTGHLIQWVDSSWAPPSIDYRQIVPTFHVRIPAAVTPTTLGTQARFDLWVTHLNVSDSIDLCGNSVSGSMNYPLWSNTGTSPGLPKEMVNTLNWGIIPAGITADVDLAYNPKIIDPEKGFLLDQGSTADTLEINGILNVAALDTIVATSIIPVTEEELPLKVFPNPTSGLTQVLASPEHKQLEVYDMIGQLIFSTVLVDGTTSLDMSPYENGSYIIRVGAKSKILNVLK